MTNSWKPTNNMTDDTVLFDAIGKIRESSDKRREIEARVLAENNLASVRQLSHDKVQKFCAIVDAILAEEADVDIRLFADNQHLAEAASKIKVTPWTKQDNNPEKNSTFMGAPKDNPNKGGYAGGAKAEKTKHGYTAMKRIKEEEVVDEGQSLGKTFSRMMTGKSTALARQHNLAQATDDASAKLAKAKKLPSKSDRMIATKTASKEVRKNHKNYKRYRNIVQGSGMSFGTRKEDLEEMYLNIENFVLESEGFDSIDRLNEQGQEKLAAIVENVMEEILAEEEENTMDESVLATGAAVALGAWGAHKVNQYLKKRLPQSKGKAPATGKMKNDPKNQSGRDATDAKNPSAVPHKNVSQAVRNDRKLAKRNNGRLSGEGY